MEIHKGIIEIMDSQFETFRSNNAEVKTFYIFTAFNYLRDFD